MKRKHAGILLAAVLALTACGGGDEDASGAPEGEITVLTNRTDLVDTRFAEYKKRFEAKYPDVTVKFEAITDYEGEVRIRLNTKDYGDVLLVPNTVTADQYPTFFEPLGATAELGATYRFATQAAFEGTTYGIPLFGNAEGIVYNRKVWQAAGLGDVPPATPQEFLAALQAVKDRTAAVPLYTNYKDGWPLTFWEHQLVAASGDAGVYNALAEDDAPWAPGKPHHTIDGLLYDAVKAGLVEADPTTTNWENSKQLLGTGEVAAMVLGSWAIPQMQAAAPDPADIGYLPFPVQVGGRFYSQISGDKVNAINVNSEHKAAARAWVDWFSNESGFAEDEAGIPPLKARPMPAALVAYGELGVEFVEYAPEPDGKQGLVARIDRAAEIGLGDPMYRQRIVDAARGARDESKEQIFADLNQKWAEARASAT